MVWEIVSRSGEMGMRDEGKGREKRKKAIITD